MITELFIESYQTDVSADLVSLLTFTIDDVKDFSARSTTFSKTVVLPGTARNNQIFGDIFETGISNDYNPAAPNIFSNFNASKSARCLLFQDNIQTFKGTIRLMQINLDHGRIEYEVALAGDLSGLSTALSNSLLQDLDFSAYDRVYAASDVVASWDNAPGSGVYFPMIDYGNYSALKHDWDIRTFRPALYVKEYIDKMFSAAGFRYTSAIFDTDRFKGLIIPHNQKILMSRVSRVLTASLTSDQTMIDSGIGSTVNLVDWDTHIAGGFSYVAGVFTYTQPTALTVSIAWNLSGDRFSTTNGTFNINVRRNGATVATTTINTFPAHVGWTWNSAVTVPLATGDTLDIQFQYGGTGTNMVVTAISGSGMNVSSTVPSLQPVDYGQTITINDAIPNNIRQVDFLKWVVQLFNLYVTEDQFDENLMRIEPFINFYNTGLAPVDWTYKLDRNGIIKVKPMSEINSKIYNFNFTNDTDYYNDLYQKRYNQVYGSFIYDSQFEFATQTTDLTIGFASTPLVGYVGEEKVYPTILKQTGNTPTIVEENVDSVIRIMQTKKVNGVALWTILNGLTVIQSCLSYGYAGHFDNPDAPTNDLNFGALGELFFFLLGGTLQFTQFNVYWSSYMAEITDKDSKLLSATFYLKPSDIFSLDFGRYIFLDGSLWRLNKIIDYNASQPALCTVELLKVINTEYDYVVFPPVVDTFRWLDADNSFVLDSDNSVILHQ